ADQRADQEAAQALRWLCQGLAGARLRSVAGDRRAKRRIAVGDRRSDGGCLRGLPSGILVSPRKAGQAVEPRQAARPSIPPSSLPGLTLQVGFTRLAALNGAELGQARVPMQSIFLRKGWMRGSSPRMTWRGDA